MATTNPQFEARLANTNASPQERDQLRRAFRTLVDDVQREYNMGLAEAEMLAMRQLSGLPLHRALRVGRIEQILDPSNQP